MELVFYIFIYLLSGLAGWWIASFLLKRKERKTRSEDNPVDKEN